MKNYTQIKKSINSKFLNLALYIIGAVVIAYLAIHMINGAVFDNFFGYTVRIVVSNSMEPEIQINSLNIIKICDIDEIEINDIICFNYNQDIVHRVIDKVTTDSGAEVLHTQGDANEFPDSVSVTSDELVGKVVRTLNWVAPIVTKYSITPGNIDSTALSRNVLIHGLIIGAILYTLAFIIHWVLTFSKSLRKSKRMHSVLETYIDDIDELILYRELLKELIDTEVKNTADTRFEYIGNKLAKAYAIQNCGFLHTELKSFKKDIKRSLFIAKLFKTFDTNMEDTKDVS